MSRIQDALGVIKGLQYALQAGVKLQEANIIHIWRNSSIRSLSEELKLPLENDMNIIQSVSEGTEKISSIMTGLKKFSSLAASNNISIETQNISNSIKGNFIYEHPLSNNN